MNRCNSHKALTQDECSGSIARWVYADRVSVTLCGVSLNFWLDLADDDPDMEPAELVWLHDVNA